MFLDSTPGKPNKRPSKGLYEQLLCKKCEMQFGGYEKYAKHLIEDAMDHANLAQDILPVSGVDYAKIKLFQLSVLWRASISTLEYFSAVSLGPHEERIRVMLLNGNPGKATDYPCVMALLEDDVLKHAPVPNAPRQPGPADLMVSPCSGRIEGTRVYPFCYAGFGWIYSVSSTRAPKLIQECAVREDGQMIVRKFHLSVFFGPQQIKLFGDRGKLG
jgi:hypothetical protein